MIKQMMDYKKIFKNSLAEADTEIINFFLWQLVIIKTVVEVFHINESCSVVSDSLQPHGLYSSWNSPGQNTGVSSLSLLQGNLGSSQPRDQTPGLPYCGQILYQLSHRGNPRILDMGSPSRLQRNDPVITPGSSALQTDSLPTELSGKP